MDENMKNLIKTVINEEIGSGELNEISNKKLKNIISDILKEELIVQSGKDP